MALVWADPGGSATGGTQALSSPVGSVSAQTSITNGQPYAYLVSTSNPAAAAATQRNAILQAAGNRISRSIRFPAAPAADTAVGLISVQPTGTGTSLLRVALDSARKLRLYTNGTTTQLGATGATVISVDTWTRITLSYAITSTTNWSAKVYVNGALEMTRTHTDGTLSSAVPADLTLRLSTTAGTDWLIYESDTFVDDTTDQTDPGDRRSTNKQPTSTTTNNFDTTVGTGAVNERPVSTTNGKSHGATSDVDQDYDIEAASAGDVDLTGLTIVGSIPWIWAALSSLTGTPSSNIIHNGARLTGTWDPTAASTAQFFAGPAVTSATYPDNANGKNIGTSSSVIAADTLLYDCGVIVVYIPAAGGTGFKDAGTRLRLAALAVKDAAARFLLRVAGVRDVTLRLRLQVGGFRDASARLRLQALAYRDTAARFSLYVQKYRDAPLRLVVQAPAWRDIGVRFMLQAANVYRDAAVRLRLLAGAYQDAGFRFVLVAAGESIRDAGLRLTINVPAWRDAGLRFLAVAPAWSDATARSRLAALMLRDAGLRLRAAVPGWKDATTRLRLRATAYRDATLRARLGVRGYQDAGARFRLAHADWRRSLVTWLEFEVPGSAAIRDATTRLRLRATAYRDTVVRLRLAAIAWRDVSVRLGAAAATHRDAGLRFALQVLTAQFGRPVADVGSAAWHDQAAGTTNLYAAIDETVASDADYIESPDATGSPSLQQIRLAPLDDPLGATGHILRVRYGKDLTGGDAVDLTVRLYGADGTTVIATRSYPGIDAATTVEITLTEGEANAIPDPDYATGLVLGFEAVAA